MHYNKVKLQVNPNNQIVLTYGNYRDTSEYYRSRLACEPQTAEETIRRNRVVGNVKARLAPKYDWRGRLIVKAKKKPSPPLAIIKKSQDGIKKCRLNHPKSFTQAAGQKLRECGAAIDKICKKPENCYTVTLTLPADTEASFTALAAYSGFAINYLFQPVRDQYKGEVFWFFVWEYQKRGALHIHLCVYHPELETTKAIAKLLYDRWYVVLEHIQDKACTDMFVRRDGKTYTPKEKYHCYIQPVRRSLGAYFSKYAGKKQSKNDFYCQKYPISRFWGSSQNLKDLIKKLSFDFTFRSGDSEAIEAIVAEIMSKLCREDIAIQSDYDFDIGKSYNGYDRISFASGTRITAYCHPAVYGEILSLFSAIYGGF